MHDMLLHISNKFRFWELGKSKDYEVLTMRRNRNQSEHDNCVRANADTLINQGYECTGRFTGL